MVHSLMFHMDMLFLSCTSFFVYAFDLKHKNGRFIVSYFVGVPQSHCPFHVCMLFEVGLSFYHSASYRLFYLNPFSITNRLSWEAILT